jgi:hypothetical protein
LVKLDVVEMLASHEVSGIRPPGEKLLHPRGLREFLLYAEFREPISHSLVG